METKPGLTVTSYSDYMRCLAAKYSDHGLASGEPPVSPASIGHDLLPILAAHHQSLKAAPMSNLALLNPFLSQESKSPLPGLLESIKRQKEDPLDLRDKMKKLKEESQSPVSPVFSPVSASSRPIMDWSVQEVADFVAGVSDCGQYAKVTLKRFTLLNFKL